MHTFVWSHAGKLFFAFLAHSAHAAEPRTWHLTLILSWEPTAPATLSRSRCPFGSVQLTPNLAGNGYYYPNDHMHVCDHHMSGDAGQRRRSPHDGHDRSVKIDRASTIISSITARTPPGLLPGADATLEYQRRVNHDRSLRFRQFTFPAPAVQHSPASQLHQQPHYFESCHYIDSQTFTAMSRASHSTASIKASPPISSWLQQTLRKNTGPGRTPR